MLKWIDAYKHTLLSTIAALLVVVGFFLVEYFNDSKATAREVAKQSIRLTVLEINYNNIIEKLNEVIKNQKEIIKQNKEDCHGY